jgi:tetratricopeptide (TPR) repeat protein
MSPAPAPAPVPSGASPEGHILALARAGRRDEALAFARGAVDGARVTGVDALLATLLVNAGEREEARGVIEAARARPSDDPRACDALAHAALRLGAHRLSRDFYARAARLAPGDAGAWYNLAASERALGALEAAGEACDAAIACDGDHAASHLLRSELRVQSADDNHVDVLRAALARAPQDGPGRVALGYALAKELDDLGESAAAWAAWTAAAAARRAQMAYDVATDEAKLARIAQVFTQGPELSAVPEGPAPFVFIVGLPRSGTTLLERMLSNLPGVVSHGETDHFAQSLLGAAPRRADLDVFARAALADPAAVGRAYAARGARGWRQRDREAADELPLSGRDGPRAAAWGTAGLAPLAARKLFCDVPHAVWRCLSVQLCAGRSGALLCRVGPADGPLARAARARAARNPLR